MSVRTDGQPESALHLYVDGSCADNRKAGPEQSAGWGLVVVSGDTGFGRARGHVVHEASGLVICDPQADDWIGAPTASSNTAELSGMVHALRWLLMDGGDGPAVIRGDSTYALNIASGVWRARANKDIATRARALWKEVSGLQNLTGEHIRAHRGHRWNERADHLAFRAQSGDAPLSLTFWKPGQR